MYNKQQNFFEVFKERYDLYNSDKTISFKVENGYEEISLKNIFQIAENFANNLIKNYNTQKEDRIAIICESRPEYPIGVFGTIKAGCIIVPLDIKLTESEQINILNDCKPKILCTSKLFYKRALELKKSIPFIEHVFLLEHNEINYNEAISIYDLPVLNQNYTVERKLKDIASIVYTSGTTGNPKGVMNSFENICSLIDIANKIGITDKSVLVSILPLNHSYELNVGLFTMLYYGAKIIYLKNWSKNEIVQAMKDFKATDMFVVPLFLNMLKSMFEEDINAQSLLCKCLFRLKFHLAKYLPVKIKRKLFKRQIDMLGGKMRMFITGGSKLDIKTSSFFDRIGIFAFQGYGLTEACSTIATNYEKNNKPLSVGKPIPGIKVKISNAGELLTSGPHIMPGYYNNPELTEKVLEKQNNDIWLHTGDKAKIDKDGYIYITGRIKNMIVLCGGKNVFPEEVEPVLYRSTLFKELCVMPFKITEGHNIGTEQVGVVIVPIKELLLKKDNEIQAIIENEVKKLSEKYLAPFKHPTKIIVRREDFPKTPTGKIKRKEVIKIYENYA
ncbi:MAG: AMP-binding protein [Clostridium sp.]|nr:AMP-binding protein [Clostridium sp.]